MLIRRAASVRVRINVQASIRAIDQTRALRATRGMFSLFTIFDDFSKVR